MMLLRVSLALGVLGTLAGCPPCGASFFGSGEVPECPAESDGSTSPPAITEVPTRVLVGTESFEVIGTGLAGKDAAATIALSGGGSAQITASVTKVNDTTVRISPQWGSAQLGGPATIVVSTTLGQSKPAGTTLVRPGFTIGASASAPTLSKPEWLFLGSLMTGTSHLFAFDSGGVIGVPYNAQSAAFGAVGLLPNISTQKLMQPAILGPDTDTDFAAVDSASPPQTVTSCRTENSYMCAQGGAYGAVWGSSSLTTLAAGAYQPGVTLVAVTSASQKLFTCLVPTNPYSVQTCKDVTGFSANARALWINQFGSAKADILVLDTAGKLQLWRSDTSDVFTNQSAALGSALTTRSLLALALADVDGVNGTDIVAVDAQGVAVLLNNGQGSQFTASSTSINKMPMARALTVGDADGDGKPDIILTEAGTGTLRILLNQMNESMPERRWLGPAPLVNASNQPVSLGANDVAMLDGTDGSRKRRILATDVANKKFQVWQNSFTP